MKLGYFPGCSLHGTARELNESLGEVARRLDLQLDEIKDWACCGASSAHQVNHLLGVALPARTLALAEEQGMERVVAPCAACFNRLAEARREIADDAALAREVGRVLDRPFGNKVEVINLVQAMRELGPAIKEKTVRPLAGLKVACYYGCLLVRPAAATNFDDPERPSAMEEVVRALGAEPVEWSKRLVCCGGNFSLSRQDSVVRLGREILEDAKAAGADVVAVACPMCQSNLDFRQKAMARDGRSLQLPILYLTQLVGLALGLDEQTLGLARHFVDAGPTLRKLAAAAPAAPAEA